jgi:hypothetical protein
MCLHGRAQDQCRSLPLLLYPLTCGDRIGPALWHLGTLRQLLALVRHLALLPRHLGWRTVEWLLLAVWLVQRRREGLGHKRGLDEIAVPIDLWAGPCRTGRGATAGCRGRASSAVEAHRRRGGRQGSSGAEGGGAHDGGVVSSVARRAAPCEAYAHKCGMHAPLRSARIHLFLLIRLYLTPAACCRSKRAISRREGHQSGGRWLQA